MGKLTSRTNASVCQLFMNTIGDRLSKGATAQDVLDDLVKLIEADNDTVDPVNLAQGIGFLAHRGARVATDEPGCAFESLVHRYKLQPGTLQLLRDVLVNIPGEIPFHVLARHYLWGVSDKDLSAPQHLAAMRTRDKHGRTMSHWLWDEHNTIIGPFAPSPSQPAEESKVQAIQSPEAIRSQAMHARVKHDMAWLLQSQLEEIGITMDIPDHQGVLPLDLCIRRVKDGTIVLVPERSICHRVQAIIQSRGMQSQTPKASVSCPNTPSPRL